MPTPVPSIWSAATSLTNIPACALKGAHWMHVAHVRPGHGWPRRRWAARRQTAAGNLRCLSPVAREGDPGSAAYQLDDEPPASSLHKLYGEKGWTVGSVSMPGLKPAAGAELPRLIFESGLVDCRPRSPVFPVAGSAWDAVRTFLQEQGATIKHPVVQPGYQVWFHSGSLS